MFDAVFIGMHGTPGEDGKLQGYFDTLENSLHQLRRRDFRNHI